LVIAGVSLLLWYPKDRVCSHSIDDGICLLQIIAGCEDSASHKIKMNINSATKEIIAPIEDKVFHVEYVSG